MTSHKIVGLTGGMASGKSTVRKMFERLGVAAWDADRAGHEVYRRHDALRQACADRWGKQVLLDDRDVDRGAIAAIVFDNPEELQWLNGQVHPLVREDFDAWLRAVPAGVPYVLRESAILFEVGIDADCAAVVCVTAPASERLARAMQRDGMSMAEAHQRMKRQLSDEARNVRCDFIIENGRSVTLSDLSTNVEKVHDLLIESLT